MQKLTSTLLTAILLFSVSQAQLRLALTGGPHAASIIETNSLPGWDSTTKPYYQNRNSLHIGVLAEVPLDKTGQWFLHPGIIYSGKGRKYSRYNNSASVPGADTVSVNSELITNYIEIPFNLTYKLHLGKKSSFLLSAGPYISFFYNGKQTWENRLLASDSTISYSQSEHNLEVGKGSEKIKTFDVGVNGRAGFEIGSVWLTGVFSQGLSNFYNASYDGTFKHRVLGASLTIWLNKAKPYEKKPKDSDGDGIPDKDDACPDQAGPAITGGCPDKDGDGIADRTDKCPDVAGLAKYNGCPIPDTDKDGINDEEDKCPTVPGVSRYNGCPIPDRDHDGVNDEEDACPDQPGTAANKGCPDTDGDGILDKDDECPHEAGTAENHGCPVIEKQVKEKVNFAAANVLFKRGSNELSASSFKGLDEVVSILHEHPDLKLVIEGHTDNTGTPALNQTLSQKRADAVKAYLVEKGVGTDRLHAIGYGQDKPIADNSTAKGRAKNRRVELKLEQ